MNATEFACWLQGFFEMTKAKKLTPAQVEMIKKHLELVFKNVTSGIQWPITITTDKTVPPTSDKITIPWPQPDQTPVPYNPYNPYDLDPWKPTIICEDIGGIKIC